MHLDAPVNIHYLATTCLLHLNI